MSADQSMTVTPCQGINGTLSVPGDKSISHRAGMLAAMADGVSVISGYLTSEDCLHTLAALVSLGARVERDGTSVRVTGFGAKPASPADAIDLGNSGTGLRLLAGLVAGYPLTVELTGDASLCSRPMGRIADPLLLMGANVDLLGPERRPPLRITGGRLKGITYALPMASAQVKSCILLAGLHAEGETQVIEPRPTRDHTERMFRAAGVCCETDGLCVKLRGGPGGVQARDWTVPGDFSSAAFWLAAAAMRPGGEVRVNGVGLNPRRTALLDVLQRMGAGVEVREEAGTAEPVGWVRVCGRGLKATEIGGDEIPNLIDELPVLAAAATLAEGRTVIRDAQELRVKESDRISAVAAALTALGARVEETADGMVVEGPTRVRGGVTVDSCGDHRIAMATAVLALCADGPVEIRDVGCIATSYPGFRDDLELVRSG